jgi:hypothetical protein
MKNIIPPKKDGLNGSKIPQMEFKPPKKRCSGAAAAPHRSHPTRQALEPWINVRRLPQKSLKGKSAGNLYIVGWLVVWNIFYFSIYWE